MSKEISVGTRCETIVIEPSFPSRRFKASLMSRGTLRRRARCFFVRPDLDLLAWSVKSSCAYMNLWAALARCCNVRRVSPLDWDESSTVWTRFSGSAAPEYISRPSMRSGVFNRRSEIKLERKTPGAVGFFFRIVARYEGPGQKKGSLISV